MKLWNFYSSMHLLVIKLHHAGFIGGCRAQNDPRHGGLSKYETFISLLEHSSLLLH